MFRIVGADGNTYGPVAADQVRKWIIENRANARTLAQAESAPDWKPLATFPEFASCFAPPPAMAGPREPAAPPVMGLPPAYDSRASAKIPAGICGILLGSFGVHKFILGYTGAGLIMLLVTLLTCFLASPIMHIIGLIEGIIYLTKSDPEFVRVYVEGRKEWF